MTEQTPAASDSIISKFRENVTTSLSASAADAVLHAVSALEQSANIGELLRRCVASENRMTAGC